jgi:hypothetical protein
VRRIAAVIVVVVTAWLGTACSPGMPGPVAAGHGIPPVTVLTQGADNGNGDIFIAPMGGGYASGPEILTNTGKVVWFHALPPAENATDFRTQIYRGKPVLTDFHEFLITPWNTALILADAFGTANLTSIGGPANQKVFDGIVEEIDIRTGKVLFQWNSADHVPYRDSHLPLPGSAAAPWDWFHINAVHLDTDGNLLIDSRYTWTTYKVNRHTGKIIWELGGKQSTFKLAAATGQDLDSAGEIFAFQHDPEAIGHDEYTFFDDESDSHTTLLGHSRLVTVRLDLATRVATLVKSASPPEGLVASAEGNAQITANGDLFVGWGALPYISEFSPTGRLLFNAQLPAGTNTYRAYILPCHGQGP